jgi:hypothetical protein
MRFTAAIINPRFNVYEGHGLLLGHWNENDKNTFYFLTCAHVVFDLRAYLPYDLSWDGGLLYDRETISAKSFLCPQRVDGHCGRQSTS